MLRLVIAIVVAIVSAVIVAVSLVVATVFPAMGFSLMVAAWSAVAVMLVAVAIFTIALA